MNCQTTTYHLTPSLRCQLSGEWSKHRWWNCCSKSQPGTSCRAISVDVFFCWRVVNSMFFFGKKNTVVFFFEMLSKHQWWESWTWISLGEGSVLSVSLIPDFQVSVTLTDCQLRHGTKYQLVTYIEDWHCFKTGRQNSSWFRSQGFSIFNIIMFDTHTDSYSYTFQDHKLLLMVGERV